jgi:hypothetical protein
MKHAGFKTLNLSLGSTSLAQLKKFGRADVRNSFEKVLEFAATIGLETISYIIAGAPGQKAEESLSDILYLARKQTLLGISIFYPSPGSKDYQSCLRSGLVPQHLSLMRSSALPISHTTSRVEAVTLMRLGRIINFIKLLNQQGLPIPAPEPCRSNRLENVNDRLEIGKILLSWFLYDGKIRGISSNGSVFEHEISTRLTIEFVQELF